MEKRLLEHKARYKAVTFINPERRREALLRRQHDIRAATAARIRAALMASTQDEDAMADAEMTAEGDFDIVTSVVSGDDGMAGGNSAAEVEGVSTDKLEVPASTATVSWRLAPAFARTRYFARQLQIPDWMTEVPADLNGCDLADPAMGWLVIPRPEGRHCLVVAADGHTAARGRDGFLMHRFQSGLHGGCSASTLPAGGGTILDCIFNLDTKTFYVLDLLYWNSLPAFEWPLEMRRWWLHSNLPDLCVDKMCLPPADPSGYPARHPTSATDLLQIAPMFGVVPPSPVSPPSVAWATSLIDEKCADDDDDDAMCCLTNSAPPLTVATGSSSTRVTNELPFVLLPDFQCTMAGLAAAYGHTLPCAKEGLLFLNKASVYTPGPTPLVLHWGDATCAPRMHQQLDSPYLAILELSFDGKLITHDCVELLNVSPEDIAAHNLSPGDLLRFAADAAFVDSLTGCVATFEIAPMHCQYHYLHCSAAQYLNPRFHSKVTSRRMHPDSWSKILYQHMLRSRPVTADDIANSIARRM